MFMKGLWILSIFLNFYIGTCSVNHSGFLPSVALHVQHTHRWLICEMTTSERSRAINKCVLCKTCKRPSSAFMTSVSIYLLYSCSSEQLVTGPKPLAQNNRTEKKTF